MTNAIAKRTGRPTRAESQHKASVARQRASGNVAKRRTLPEYLEQNEVDALIAHAGGFKHKLLMAFQWRAGLRVSEALDLLDADLRTDAGSPHISVKAGKGGRNRLVEMHPALLRDIVIARDVEIIPARGMIFGSTTRQTAWQWVKAAQKRAESDGSLPHGRKIGTHTLRHSAARHWLANGVQINVVSRWLGHSSIQTTLIYLEILPDPMGYMERIP